MLKVIKVSLDTDRVPYSGAEPHLNTCACIGSLHPSGFNYVCTCASIPKYSSIVSREDVHRMFGEMDVGHLLKYDLVSGHVSEAVLISIDVCPFKYLIDNVGGDVMHILSRGDFFSFRELQATLLTITFVDCPVFLPVIIRSPNGNGADNGSYELFLVQVLYSSANKRRVVSSHAFRDFVPLDGLDDGDEAFQCMLMFPSHVTAYV